jgi:hypothetical protein
MTLRPRLAPSAPRTPKIVAAGCLLAVAASLVACRKPPPPAPADATPADLVADTGFRPSQHGYRFQNTGGQYPKTPAVLTAAGVVKLFGKDACLGGDDGSCKLTPAAIEWLGAVNKAMNVGQCEGMAVSSLAFFKKLYDPATFAAGATSAHDLQHDAVGPLIGYFWAFQMVNPVRLATVKSRLTQTPSQAEDALIDLMKRGELATVAIWSPHGGHAVSPYSIEDRGNGIHWIHIYDNNWPDKDRYIVVDRQANTWKYELASLNPDVPRAPWSGTAESHSFAVIPLSTRLGKAECPFCTGGKKLVVPQGANGVTLTNQDGKRIGRDGDKVVNEIPDAEVVDLNSYLDGAPAGEPMYAVPADADYEVAIAGGDAKAGAGGDDHDHGVVIVGNGTAVAVETPRLGATEKDTMSLSRDGGVKYTSGSGGTIPPIRLAADSGGSGMSVRIANMKAGAGEALEVKLDHRAGTVSVQGGGKKSESYDLKVKHVHAKADDHEVEQKGIKYKAGESHTVRSDPRPGAKPTPLGIKSAPTPPKPRVEKAKDPRAPKPAPARPAPRR